MSRNLTPIMLVIGPLMLVGAFLSWPLQNAVGMEAVQLLRDDASIVLAAVGVLGMSLMFGGLHLLSMDMKKGADRMSTQLLNMADLFIFGTYGLFLTGFGAQTAVILLTNDTTAVYEDQATREAVALMVFNAGNGLWALTPVAWGLAMISMGLAHVGLKVPEGLSEGAFFMLMPVGFANTLLPLIQDAEQAEFQIVFPLTMFLYIALGGLMLSGNIDEPGSE
tara:strand:- start:589 stop:1254 length:666 start_codon:yes stop_codon:yes gene_type:complete